MPETPEDRARRQIDADLTVAGWLVQDRDDIELTAGRGIAVRGFPMKPGFGFAEALNSPQTRKRVSSTIHSAGRARLRLADIKSIAIPIAPRGEQVRIADALDEFLSDLDAGVAALERVRDKLRVYRASVLRAAVEGELTAQWREQHPHQARRQAARAQSSPNAAAARSMATDKL